MHHARSLGLVALTLSVSAACSGTGSTSASPNSDVGGSAANTGGVNGLSSTARASGTDTGGSSTNAAGGTANSGGTWPTGGRAATGSARPTGGSEGTGGSVAGNPTTGGAAPTGGSKATGGAGTGGAGAGGTVGACFTDTSSPPSNVSGWINESWNAELGNNISSRKAWLLDNIMMGKGQINLCVRWGASTAPTVAVKSGMAAAVQKWMNDWFTTLNYGGFPYCNGVDTKVTGWAVKPGNASWVSDLDSSIKIYTETDADGEPKCPDACSFFNNWAHTFPSCPGGEAYHTDYWLWLDDSISGGAAAVGGDWGLRMPVSNFISAMGKSNVVIEHEMGHGFGFQDYYTWTGSTPTGGSLMIVGSTNSPIPTTGDIWLLRRTWMESKALRGW